MITATYKMTGRPDGKPIVDLLGADVELAFPTASHVLVSFGRGRIRVRPAEEKVQRAHLRAA